MFTLRYIMITSFHSNTDGLAIISSWESSSRAREVVLMEKKNTGTNTPLLKIKLCMWQLRCGRSLEKNVALVSCMSAWHAPGPSSSLTTTPIFFKTLVLNFLQNGLDAFI